MPQKNKVHTLVSSSYTIYCPTLDKEVVILKSLLGANSQECDMCGSHGAIELSFSCECGEHHYIELNSW